jgi:hypothetical protein
MNKTQRTAEQTSGASGAPAVRSWAVSRLRALSCVAIAAFACALILSVAPRPAAALSLKENPFLQQGEKLTASGVSELAEQGSSVAISANGDTALVGAPAYNSFKGAAWVYVRTGSTWSEQAKLVGKEEGGGSGFTKQGFSVALSANGDTALIGGPGDGTEGAAWAFTRSGSTWEEKAKLVGKEASGDAEQGSSVALSANGETALVGGHVDAGGVGAAWVFTGSGSSWSQQGKKLVGAHGAEPTIEQGTSVALSGDGNTALIGGPSAEKEKGAVWVFTRASPTWKEQAKLPAGTGAGEKTGQGQSVALSTDGKTALVGGPGEGEATGAGWVFTRSGEAWSQQGGALLATEATPKEAQVGHSVSLSENGNTALLGGYHDDVSVGAAWAFVRSGSTWGEQEKLVGTGSKGGFPTQGSSVALSGDGFTALVGGAGDNGEVGATWVFARTPESGEKEKEKEQEQSKEETKEPFKKEQSPPSSGNVSTATGAGSSTGSSSSSGSKNNQPPPPPSAAQLEEHLATAFGLPSAKLCYSKRSFKIHIQQPPGYPRIVSAEVFLGHKRERTLNKHGLTDQVVLTQLPYGTFTIRIVARTVQNTTLTGTRTYHTCRPKPIHPHGHPRL